MQKFTPPAPALAPAGKREPARVAYGGAAAFALPARVLLRAFSARCDAMAIQLHRHRVDVPDLVAVLGDGAVGQNLPLRAVLRMDMRVQRSASCHAALTFSWQAT